MESLIGKVFGRLTVIGFSHKDENYQKYWICECSCDGKLKSISQKSLIGGNAKSCGCLKKEKNKEKKKSNRFEETDDYIIGYDEKNRQFYIDKEDLGKIEQHYWSVGYNGYVSTCANKIKFSMHRFIMSVKENEVIDHINHVEYDNRKSNLRICTTHQNVCNKKLAKNNSSGFKGVCKEKNKWHSYIFFDGKTIHLGRFEKIEDAINARIEAEIKFFGEFSQYYNKEL